MKESKPPKIVIGRPGWLAKLRAYGKQIDPDYWDDFTPVAARQLDEIEKSLARKLPEDYRLFMKKIGAGNFPLSFGGDFNKPRETIGWCHGPLMMRLGCASWASRNALRKFYITRGQYNPAPEKFTPGITKYDGVDLLDLLQIGSDGSCCYHQLYVGHKSRHFKYCLLTDFDTYDNRSKSFSEGLCKIMHEHWKQRFEE